MTGKALGFKKGDFVMTPMFPAIIISDVHTFAPCCEAWGFEHEMGSACADELIRISREDFISAASEYGFDGSAYSAVSRAALKTSEPVKA